MILKFDVPITLDEALGTYTKTVKFITDSFHYPNVMGIEFDARPDLIVKGRVMSPKIEVKRNKLMANYEKSIGRIYNKYMKKIRTLLASDIVKASIISIPQTKKEEAKKILEEMRSKLHDKAEDLFEDGYKLGKLRSQVLTSQDIDDDLNDDDYDEIEDQLESNDKYLLGFTDHIQDNLDEVVDGQYESYDEVESKIDAKVVEANRNRMLSYAVALGTLITLGTINGLEESDEEVGHTSYKNTKGVWSNHPELGLGGVICDGCHELNGQEMTIEEYRSLKYHQDCLSNCRCRLELEDGVEID